MAPSTLWSRGPFLRKSVSTDKRASRKERVWISAKSPVLDLRGRSLETCNGLYATLGEQATLPVQYLLARQSGSKTPGDSHQDQSPAQPTGGFPQMDVSVSGFHAI